MKPVYTPITQLPEFLEQQEKETFTSLFDFIPLMEKEFARVNKILKTPLTKEAAMKFLDFEDTKQELFKALCQSGLLVDFEWEHWVEGHEILSGIRSFPRLNAIKICKLLTLIVRNDQIKSGFFEAKLKQGTVLDLLKQLQIKLLNH
ncbi:DUF6508 domain-containing protein [Pararhodonellum marinum]|uniref:DUF6508 domain-containing protein n=1 Tax=Pararhodonellum marinum TaxID=2755358 RepID=UPI00188F8F2B|nr:DUF6508 domain-containing protein [Pararhodonellum marinum]